MNTAVRVSVFFTSQSVIGQTFQIRIRGFNNLTETNRTDNWQSLTLHCKESPNFRIPKRLSTGITWGPTFLFLNNQSAGIDSIQTYKGCGLNTVPTSGTHYYTNFPTTDLLSPANRTSAVWNGMYYGPQHRYHNPHQNDFLCVVGYFESVRSIIVKNRRI
jgi:hypothetical protein